MDRSELVFTLALGTIAIVLVYGLWQFFSVRRSQAKRGEQTGPAGGTRDMLHHRDPSPGDLEPQPAVRERAAARGTPGARR